MSSSSVRAGVLILALLGLLDVISPWLIPAPPQAPPFADALSLVFGVVTLLALGLWLARATRVAMWVAVVLRAISGLFAIPAFFDAPSAGFQIVMVVAFVATIVGIVLVRPALARSRTRPGSPV